jgi:uncharacterized protein YgbK (DUF1537 family)
LQPRQLTSIAVIADDMTGAADTGVQFCPLVGPVLVTSVDSVHQTVDTAPAAIAISTASRADQPHRAATRVAAAYQRLAPLSPDNLYKKIDSCLRGNLGAELDILLEKSSARACFVAPALPTQGRTTVHDVHYINNIPVAHTEMGRDPVSPVTESRVSRLLASQSSQTVAHIDLAEVEQPDHVLSARVQELLAQGFRHLVFDATENRHLESIAGLLMQFQSIIPVGSAGLAAAIAGTRTKGQKIIAPLHPRIISWLMVCGSLSGVINKQLTALCGAYNFAELRISLAHLDESGVPAATEMLDRAADQWQPPGLIIRTDPASRPPTLTDPSRLIRAFAEFGAAVARRVHPEGLLLSGGDTADAVRTALGAEALMVYEEVEPGVISAALVGGAHHGLPVFTKAGAFGTVDTLQRIVSKYC